MPSDQTAALQIPDAVRKQFPELLSLILESESMNDEERRYWIGILPVMTPPQRDSLRDILTRERQQLRAIDSRYAAAARSGGSIDPQARSDQLAKRQTAERQTERKEAAEEADVLRKIEEA
jgi:hypothetical protein